MTKKRWTNRTLKDYLHKLGFLDDPEPIAMKADIGTVIAMNRLHERIIVVFPSELKQEEPKVYWFDKGIGTSYDFTQYAPIDPETLGVRNPEIQNDGSSDE